MNISIKLKPSESIYQYDSIRINTPKLILKQQTNAQMSKMRRISNQIPNAPSPPSVGFRLMWEPEGGAAFDWAQGDILFSLHLRRFHPDNDRWVATAAGRAGDEAGGLGRGRTARKGGLKRREGLHRSKNDGQESSYNKH